MSAQPPLPPLPSSPRPTVSGGRPLPPPPPRQGSSLNLTATNGSGIPPPPPPPPSPSSSSSSFSFERSDSARGSALFQSAPLGSPSGGSSTAPPPPSPISTSSSSSTPRPSGIDVPSTPRSPNPATTPSSSAASALVSPRAITATLDPVTFGRSTIFKESWLQKQGGSRGGWKNWKTRWFVLDKEGVSYYDTDKAFKSGKPPLGVLPLNDQLKIEVNPKMQFSFISSERTLIVKAKTQPQKDEWLASLDQLRAQLRAQPAATSSSSSSSNGDSGTSGGGDAWGDSHSHEAKLQSFHSSHSPSMSVSSGLPTGGLTTDAITGFIEFKRFTHSKSFRDNMQHQMVRVDTQVKAGLHVVRRLASYLTKITAAQLKYTAEVAVHSNVEKEKATGLIQEDEMKQYVGCAVKVQEVIAAMIEKERTFADKTQKRICVPLTQWEKINEAKRVKLMEEEFKLANTVQAKLAKMSEQRRVCWKGWKSLQDGNRELKASTMEATTKKLAAALIKYRDKVRKEFVKFEELKADAFQFHDQYDAALSRILASLETIESERLQIMDKTLTEYSLLQREYVATIPLTGAFEASTRELNSQINLQKALDKWVQFHGAKPAYRPPSYDLPCPPAALEGDDWLKVKRKRKPFDAPEGFTLWDEKGDSSTKDAANDASASWANTGTDLASLADLDAELTDGLDLKTDKSDNGKDDKKDPKKDKAKKTFVNAIRGKVSKKKMRYIADGFDLDLTYITPNIIAMGFPAEAISGIYRNNLKDVQRFMNTRHPGAYKLYNLCSEAEYEPTKFEGRVSRFPFDDHNPSRLVQIEPFCQDVDNWLKSNPLNLAAIHCKAGKGRTGYFIACYMLHCGFAPTADHALQYFAVKRTVNAKGVTIPSQMRFVHYYERLLKLKRAREEFEARGEELPSEQDIPDSNPLNLKMVVLHNPPRDVPLETIWFDIRGPERKEKYSAKGHIKSERSVAHDSLLWTASDVNGITQCDHDQRVDFYHGGKSGIAKEGLFHFWFNTRMLQLDEASGCFRLVLEKMELDKCRKDVTHTKYPEGMHVELVFQSVLLEYLKTLQTAAK